jgi:thiol-disulfide isomerase/thioredoxin
MLNKTGKLETLVNVAIVVVAVAVCAVLAKQYLLTGAPGRSHGPEVGSKIDVAGVDLAGEDRTLLLVLQKGCHFCSESAPFYQRLARETARKSGVHLVAVLPQDVAEGSKYLNSLGVPIEDVRQAQLDALGVSGTPTLILIDDKGVVMKSWVGKLSGDREAEVLDQLHASM